MEYPEYKQDFDTHFAQPLRALGLEAAESPDGQMLMIGPYGAIIATMENYEFQTLLRVPSQQRPIIVWDLARYLLPEEKIIWGGYVANADLDARANAIEMMKLQARWIVDTMASALQGQTDILNGYQLYIQKRAQYYKFLDGHLPQGHELRNSFTGHGYLEKVEQYLHENGIDPASLPAV